jgi:N-acetylglutamate synthase/N-acetylornithine aminotransferase
MNHVVLVKLFGFLERLAGHRETNVTVDDATTIRDLLMVLAEKYGADFASSIFRAPHEVHTHLRVFLNEEEAAVSDRVVRDGSVATEVVLLVLPAFEGG